MDIPITYTAFDNTKLFCRGALDEVVLKIKNHIGKADNSSILIFSDATGKIIDFNFQGKEKEVLKRLEVFISDETPSENAGPGRPKLGVISREVSLLPKHWEWLASQTGGASVTLRKLVDEAKKKSVTNYSAKHVQEATHKFMSAMAGDFQNFEDALRALYRKDQKMFVTQISDWPTDIKKHVSDLATPVFK